MNQIKKKIPMAVFAALGLSVAVATPAYAQQAQRVEKIEVTGSNIKRVDSETAEPIIVITREEIQNSGKATINEYLQTLAVNGMGALPTSFGNGFAAGATAISLRGLGANATLVLLNGRRLPLYPRADDFQKMFSDLSSVPMEAVERIEILKDGASAIYGSDALAGVVNIILRKDFTGAIGQVQLGTSRYSDGDSYKAGLIVGGGDISRDKWNGFINFEASKNDEIHYRDRDRDWIGKGDTRPWGYDPLASQWTPGYLIGSTASANPGGLVRNGTSSGAYQQATPCANVAQRIVPRIDGDNGCSYDIGQFRSFLPDNETMNIFARGTFAFNANWEAYGELSYSKSKTEFDVSPLSTPATLIGPYGIRGYGTGINVPELTLAASHPDNPNGINSRFRYTFAEFGAQRRINDTDATRIVAGIKGSAAGWDFDGGYVHAESTLDQDYTVLRVQGVLDAFNRPGSATFGYRFNNPAANTDAQRASLLTHGISHAKTKLDVIDARASRELMTLPGGSLALAVGAEYRKTYVNTPSQSGSEDGTIQANYNGGFTQDDKVYAAYGELLAPVIKGVELSGAVRYDHYDAFNSTTPKVSAKWVPIQQLALRASYAEGFRAPNAAESSVGHLAAFGSAGAYDPVRCPNGAGPLPGATAADCTGSAVAGAGSGNPDLKPEKSKSMNFGFIFEPVRNLSVGADFWKIKKSDSIQTISTQEAFFLPSVVRSDNNLPGIPNSGSALVVFAPYVNKGEAEVSGMDLDLSYMWNTQAAGRFKSDLHWTRTASWKLIDGGVTTDYAGTHGNCDVTNCIGTPKDKVVTSVSWDMGPFGLTGIVNWRSSMKNTADKESTECLATFADGTDAPNGCRIPSFWTLDLSGRWNVTKSLQVFGSIANVTDKVAPLDATTYGGINYNPMDVSGAMGRYYRLGLRYTFK
ncbi:MAG: TonB-dependent receptor [Usitatibacter sp.]